MISTGLASGSTGLRILLAQVCIVLLVSCHWAAGQDSDIDPRLADEPYVAKGSPQAWALAADAMHSLAQGAKLDRLCWGSPTRSNVAQVRKDLKEGPWQVSSREEVMEMLEYTQREGYSPDFWALGKYLTEASPEEREAFIAESKGKPASLDRIQIALEYYPKLKVKGLQGWDLTRCIAFCRRAYTAGYLEREETWRLIMPLARRLQSTFGSWEDLSNNYLLGRRFWSKQNAGNDALKTVANGLLVDRRSVWNTIPWTLDLR